MKRFERIVGARLRESRLFLLIPAYNRLHWTDSYWRVNHGSRTAEMPVRGRARGGKQGGATIASVLGIEVRERGRRTNSLRCSLVSLGARKLSSYREGENDDD